MRLIDTHIEDPNVADAPMLVTPLASIPIGANRQLRVATISSSQANSVELRTFLRDGGRGFRPAGPPMFVFQAQLDALIEALNDAADAFGAGPAPATLGVTS